MKTIEELYGYFSGIMCAPRQTKNQQYAPLIAGYFLLIGGVQVSGLYNFSNGVAVMLTGLAGLLFLCGAVVGVCLNNKPNVATLMPISPKKSLVFRYVSPFILCVIVAALILAVMVVSGLTVLAVMAIVDGGLNFEDSGDEIEEIVYSMGVYGGIFAAAYFVIMYSASMITGFIQSRKIRNWYLVGFMIILFAAILLTGTPYYVDAGTDRYIASPFINVCYESMRLPWLCITFWCLAAAALLGTAIYLGIKRYFKKY